MVSKIDFVFPYVDSNDPYWQRQYSTVIGGDIQQVRYRSWDTLKYMFRGISKFMPFIDKVYMIVSSKSQIPDWIDTSKVNIVLHEDIIPKSLLPTFNSCTIEMFLGNIPGLSEHFVYGNDDTLPISDITISDLFSDDGLPCLHFNFFEKTTPTNIFRQQCLSGKNFVETITNTPHTSGGFMPDHVMLPMLKSTCKMFIDNHLDEIMEHCTKTRDVKNFNQYIYHYWQYYRKEYCLKQLPFLYWKCTDDINLLYQTISRQQVKAVCINDTKENVDIDLISNTIDKTFTKIGLDKPDFKFEIDPEEKKRQEEEKKQQELEKAKQNAALKTTSEKVRIAESSLDSYKKLYSETNSKLVNARDRISDLESSVNDLTKIEVQLRADISLKDASIRELQSKIESLESKMTSLKDKNKNLSEKNKATDEKAKEEINELNETLRTQTETTKNVQVQLDDALHKIQEMDVKINSLELDKKKEIGDRDKKIDDLEKCIVLQNKEIDDNKDAYERSMNKLETSLNKMKESYKEEVNGLKKDLSDKEFEIDAKEKEIIKLKSDVEFLNAYIDDYCETNDKNEENNKALQDAIESKTVLSEELNKMKSYCNELESSIKNKDEEIDVLKDNIAEKDAHITTANDKMSIIEADKEELIKKLSAFESELGSSALVDSLKTTLKAKDTELSSVKTELAKMKLEVMKLNNELHHTKMDNFNYKKTITDSIRSQVKKVL